MRNLLNGAKMVQKITWMHIVNWANHNQVKYPPLVIRGLFWACSGALAMMLAAIGLNLISGATGRIAEDIIMQTGMAVLWCLFAFTAGVIVRTFFLSVPEAVSSTNGKQRPQMIAARAEWTAPDISRDNLFCLMPGEEMSAFKARCDTALNQRSYAVWSVILAPFRSECAILTADSATDYFFTRGDEPFKHMLLPGEELDDNLDYGAESLEQYQRYVEWFCAHYSRWEKSGVKLAANHSRAQKTMFELVEQGAKTVVFTLLTLLCFLPALSAQSKTRQVDESLGTRIREIPKSGDKITYTFNEKGKVVSYNRTGDGKSEYTTLLQNPPGIGGYNDEGGQLLWIEKNGEVICRAERVQQVNETPGAATRVVYLPENNSRDPVRPYALPVENTDGVPDAGFAFSMPDSGQVATQLDGLKNDIRQHRSEIWKSVAPVWQFLMWCFGGLLIFLICAWGIFNYIAGSAANESLVTIYGRVIAGRWIVAAQQNAAALCLVICWIIVITLLVNEFLWLVWLNLPVWLLLLCWFPSLWVAKRMTDWAVPNLKVVSGSGRQPIPYEPV